MNTNIVSLDMSTTPYPTRKDIINYLDSIVDIYKRLENIDKRLESIELKDEKDCLSNKNSEESEWFAKELNKTVDEFDEFDMYIVKVLESWANREK